MLHNQSTTIQIGGWQNLHYVVVGSVMQLEFTNSDIIKDMAVDRQDVVRAKSIGVLYSGYF